MKGTFLRSYQENEDSSMFNAKLKSETTLRMRVAKSRNVSGDSSAQNILTCLELLSKRLSVKEMFKHRHHQNAATIRSGEQTYACREDHWCLLLSLA